jgi:pyrroline-5-carboxylate reductase
MMAGGESFSTLRDKVTSKKGVTAEALESFQQDDLKGIMERGFDRAYRRSQELAQMS